MNEYSPYTLNGQSGKKCPEALFMGSAYSEDKAIMVPYSPFSLSFLN